MLTWNKAYSVGSNYIKPVHNYQWARILAMESWHLETPLLALLGWRMVYLRQDFWLVKIDKYGEVVDIMDLTDTDINSKQWRLWTDNGKLIREEQ